MKTTVIPRYAFSLVLTCALALGTVGCASHKEVTRVETTTSTDENPDYRASADFDETRTTTTRSETVHEDRDDPDRGLFGIVGNIIALPFRAVGALFEAIF